MGHDSFLDIELVRQEMEYWNVPGLAVTIVQDDRTLLSTGFGWRDKEKGLKTDENTLFGIASCSKAMTSALIAMLVEEGKLDYDTPVCEYAPELIMFDPVASKQMTLRDMLCHRTGLGGHDALWPDCITRNELAMRLRFLQPSASFRSNAQYSNLIYTMIGYVAECVTHQPWERLMEEYVFAPLDMNRTNCTAQCLKSDVNHAEPYQVQDGRLVRLPIWNVDLAGPAASVNSTALDMSKWMAFHISGGKTKEGKPLLSSALFSQMHTAQIDYIDSSGMGEGFYPCNQYAMGWAVGTYRGYAFQKHMGKIEGYSSIQAYLPEKKLGVAILINLHSPSVPLLYTILYSIFDRALAIPSADWSARFHSSDGPSKEEYRDCEMDLFRHIVPTGSQALAHSLTQYTGRYTNAGYGDLTIYQENDILYMHYHDMHLPLRHFHGEIFRVDGVKEDILTLSVPLTFFDGNDGLTDRVHIRLEPLLDDIVFLRKENISPQTT